MGIVEAERRVQELNALVKAQMRLIRKLEERGKDLTSAKIVFDSLRVSLFLATQDWHRVRCHAGLDQTRNGGTTPELKAGLVVVPNGKPLSYLVRSNGEGPPMQEQGDDLRLADKIASSDTKEQLDRKSVV